ncbi:hypothetical protein D770_20360 [Flammeovirgaceae bacterium 311]|nr:hypothetical protein D770_20360 [Flammeovirgaceae bacterium 311]
MLDIQIKPEGYTDYVSLELPENFNLSMEDNNPLFAIDIIEGTYSFATSLPASPHNTRLLNFANDWHASTPPPRQIPARLFKDGILHSPGILMLRGSGAKGFRINYQSKMSGLGDKLSMKLTELNQVEHVLLSLNNISFLRGQDKQGNAPQVTYAPPLPDGNRKWVRIRFTRSLDITFASKVKINEEEFVRVDLIPIENIIDNINASQSYRACYEFYRYGSSAGENDGMDLFIWQLNGDPSAPLEVTFEDPIKDPTRISVYDSYAPYWNAAIQASIDALYFNNAESNFVCPTFYGPNLWTGVDESLAIKLGKQVNRPKLAGNGYELAPISPHFSTYSIVPMFTLKYLLRQIESTTGVRIMVNWGNMPGLEQLFLFNTQTINCFEKVYEDYWVGTYQPVIKPIDHLPDMSVSEFLLELKKLFALSITYSVEDNVLTIGAIDNALKGKPIEDWTIKTDPDYDIEWTENPGLKVGYKTDKDDVLTQIVSEDGVVVQEGITTELVIGSGQQDYRSMLSPTLVAHLNGAMKMPKTSLKGGWFTSKVEVKPKVLLYHGISASTRNHPYPFASIDNIDSNGNVVGLLSLELEGDYSLYKLYLRRHADMMHVGLQISGTLYLSLPDLLNWEYNNVYRINQRNFLIRKLSYNLNRSETIIAKAEIVSAY